MKQACSLESMVDAVLSEMKRRGNAKNTIERHERAYSQFYEYALTQGENSYSKVLARSFLEEKEKLSAYAKAVAWAVENGITTGTGDGKFSPDATCTRAQSVTFLFRAIGKLVDSKAEFIDVLTDSYYANAVSWAVENGVTQGIGDGLFGPDNSCTRAQIVTFLYRAYQGK